MKKKKKIVLLLACISLMICIGATATTYAKYYTRTDGHIGSNIKKWAIKVNNESVKQGQTLSQPITAIFDVEEHVALDKMAPGSQGYFQIEIDYSEIDLSFRYEISIEENAALTDIAIYKLEVDGIEIPSTNGLNISNDVLITDEDPDKIKQVKVYIKWNDDSNNGATMDNEADTQVPATTETIDFNVGIKLTQLT